MGDPETWKNNRKGTWQQTFCVLQRGCQSFYPELLAHAGNGIGVTLSLPVHNLALQTSKFSSRKKVFCGNSVVAIIATFPAPSTSQSRGLLVMPPWLGGFYS